MPTTELVLTAGSQSVATRPTSLTSPWNLSEITNSWFAPQTDESETLRVGPTVCILTNSSR